MKIITLAAAKGGVGKTTLAAALATAAISDQPDAKVGLVDLDPQGSLTLWWNTRALPQPFLLEVAADALAQAEIALRADGLDLLIIDCPPGFSGILEHAIAVADLVLVPTGPSKLDLAAVASTAAMAKRAGVPYRFMLNRAVFRSRLAGQAMKLLRELGNLVWLPVHQRVAIAEAMAGGRTALETEPDGAAARELRGLWLAVRATLGAKPVRWGVETLVAGRFA